MGPRPGAAKDIGLPSLEQLVQEVFQREQSLEKDPVHAHTRALLTDVCSEVRQYVPMRRQVQELKAQLCTEICRAVGTRMAQQMEDDEQARRLTALGSHRENIMGESTLRAIHHVINRNILESGVGSPRTSIFDALTDYEKNDVIYTSMAPSDITDCMTLLMTHFKEGHDVLAKCLEIPKSVYRDMLYLWVPRMILSGTCVKALEKGTGRLVGVALGEDLSHPDPQGMGNLPSECDPILDCLEFMTHQMRKKAGVSLRVPPGAGRLFMCRMLAVDPHMDCRGIGTELTLFIRRAAEEAKFRHVFALAPTQAMEHVYLSAGFERAYRVNYDQYKWRGQLVFAFAELLEDQPGLNLMHCPI